MMGMNKQMVFQLEVYHGYFSNGLCTCLQFVPTAETLAVQKRFGFLLNYRDNGFEWHANTATPMAEYLEYIGRVTGSNSFDFNISTGSEAFFNFTQLPAGWAGQFTFTTNNREENNLQMQLSGTPVTGSLGKLQILFSDLAQLPGTNKVYNIRFNARATQWQYYIVNNSMVPLNNPFIKGNEDGAVQFEGPQTVTTTNGQQALLFTSGANLIPLSETPKHKFSLVNRSEISTGNGPSAKPVFKGLPQPDPGYSELVQIDGVKQVSSPMYIYL